VYSFSGMTYGCCMGLTTCRVAHAVRRDVMALPCMVQSIEVKECGAGAYATAFMPHYLCNVLCHFECVLKERLKMNNV